MRRTRVTLLAGLCLGLVATARADAEPPPPLSQALATARAEHKVLVAEFSAVWCEPCRYLEEHVLPLAAVQAALQQVVFVQYDAERGPGPGAAARLRPEGFPTLIAVDADGNELSRVVGVREAPALAAWLRSVANPLSHHGKPRRKR